MLESINEVINSVTTNQVSLLTFGILVVSALILGVVLSLAVQYKNHFSKSFAITIATLPPIVSVVIMMVNGSIGTGIAVAGTFSLVRFRSIPGTAKEITSVFIAMAIGLACGMGKLEYAFVFTLVIIIAFVLLENSAFGQSKVNSNSRIIRITIPEDLDYTDVFKDLFESYTTCYELKKVKTANLGSLFRLTYHVQYSDIKLEKEFIDQLRVRNGNLEISSSMISTGLEL